MDGHQQVNGVGSHCNAAQQANGSQQRMPTVQEALPFTPLSSIIPFSPNVIPPPFTQPTTSPSLFATPEDGKNARKLLEQLSAGATSAETASRRCQQTLNDVKLLLDPESLTRYRFKRRAPTQTIANHDRPPVHATSAKLTPFARMVFDLVDVPFRYLTPESPNQSPQNNIKEEVPVPDTHTNLTPNGTTPHSSSQQRRLEVVVVKRELTPTQRAQYQYVPKADFSTVGQAGSSRNISTSQQQKGDQAVVNLQNLLLEIFEAQDAYEDNTGSELAATYFTTREIEGTSTAVLQPHAQSKLESVLHRAASCGRLGDMEVDHLQRVQRLCEPRVATLDGLSLHVGEDWSDSDVDEWLHRLKAAESGLAATRTLIWIMTGVQKKELQSEDYLRAILEGLSAVVGNCIIPIVQEPALERERVRGEKETPPANPKFLVAVENRKEILALLQAATKCLRALGDLLVKNNLEEAQVSSVEYLCKTLIFAENASTDKESALGVQNFETLRRCGMDVLAKIFTKYTEQRQYIFDEILISLEKLPATKQSARQYRLAGAKPIQLVSALLMRLVQTSATKSSETLKLRSAATEASRDDNDKDASAEDLEEEEESEDEDEIRVSPTKASNGRTGLEAIVKPLHDAAQSNASYIVHVLITRALATTKSSEEPYRKLLDIFTEDFLSCLGFSDWPAAELILRALTARMIGIIEDKKSSVPSQTFALEMLGTMGSGIVELQMAARRAAESVEPSDPYARPLRDMVKQLETGTADAREVLAFQGPHRIVIEHINARNTNDDAHLTAAKGYYLMQWAFATFSGRASSTESDGSDTPRSSKDLQAKLSHMLTDSHWLDEHGGLDNLTSAVGNLAAMVVALNSPFCKAFNRMFGMLLSSMSSDSSLVKSRSIKSVMTLIEKDKTLLTRNAYVLQHILRCASDSSPLVRDSALGLIAPCMAQQPSLSTTIYKQIILRTNDGAVGVRKRAMRMLKDIYLLNDSNTIRSAVANAIIARTEDTEDSVVEIARTTMEEIWFQPLYMLKLEGDKAIEGKLAFAAHAALFIETVERSDEVIKVLESLLRRLLGRSKAADANAKVCRTLIAVLFDGTIDNTEIPGAPEQDGILRSLTILARACPKLFTPTQLERLEPYTQHLNNDDNLEVYRSVVIILRHTLPHQAVMNQQFLQKMHATLLQATVKLRKPELSETVSCLWTISEMIGDTRRLSNFVISVLAQLDPLRKLKLVEGQPDTNKVWRYITLLGEFGNSCKFDAFLADFKKKLPWYKGSSVADLIVESIVSFASPIRPLEVRKAALEAVCCVCQAWPKYFNRKDVENAFSTVFQSHEPQLELVLLRGLEMFFTAQETPEDNGDTADAIEETGQDRLSKTYVASDEDGASIAMAQRFLPDILRLAVSSCDTPAFVAARLVISINKQGLVHPKESVPTFVALETCPDKAVAAAAFKEHKNQHAKNEGIYDKEYMRAVVKAYEYQRDVMGDAEGYVNGPAQPTAKMALTWEVLKTAKAVVRKKFLSSLASKMDFDVGKMRAQDDQQHLGFVRFCAENVAFLEYDRVDDLMALLSALEKVFAGTGSVVAQSIESEVLGVGVDGLTVPGAAMTNGVEATSQHSQPTHSINANRLQHLALFSQVLALIWETRSFLLRLWNMQKHVVKPAKQAKDAARAPNRATNASALTDAYLRRVAEICVPRTSEETCRATCSAFAELISIDNDVKIADDEDGDGMEDAEGEYDTPSERSKKSPSLPPSGGPVKGRKRKLSGVGATPRKRGRPSGNGNGKRRSGKFEEDEDEDGWD